MPMICSSVNLLFMRFFSFVFRESSLYSGIPFGGYVRTLNPSLVRGSLDLWWHDASAKAMMEEYRGNTRVLFAAKSLNTLDYTKLSPGDFAVTSSGVHTLAYVGNRTWIEADPGPMRVIQVRVPTKNAWFSMPVKIVRWQVLE
jgi:hypothetical protein